MESIEIVFITDIHGKSERYAALTHRTAGCDVLLFGGDLTNAGGTDAVRAMLEPLRAAYGTVLGVLGNMDRPETDAWLVAESLSLHGRSREISGWGVYGCGGSNPTPFGTPNEVGEDEIAAILDRGRAGIAPGTPSLLVSHSPPLDTGADRVDSGAHVGSSAVRRLLDSDAAPVLCLSGHIHSSAAVDRVGATVVCNPGDFASGHFARIRLGGSTADHVECVIERL